MTVTLSAELSAHARDVARRIKGESFRRLADALVEAEAHPSMLRVHGEDGSSYVFVDEGRIAWAVAPGTRKFLVDRVAGVELAALSSGAFAEMLFEHTVLSLGVMLSQRISRIERHARSSASFANAFTFPMVPLLAEAVRRRSPELVAARDADERVVAVEFSVVDGHAVPLRVLSANVPRLSALLSLASDAQQVAGQLGVGTASFRRGNRSWSVSGSPSSFVVSEGRSPLSFAWMVGQQRS